MYLHLASICNCFTAVTLYIGGLKISSRTKIQQGDPAPLSSLFFSMGIRHWRHLKAWLQTYRYDTWMTAQRTDCSIKLPATLKYQGPTYCYGAEDQ